MAAARVGRLDLASLGGLHWIAVGLALLTGLLHVYAGVVDGRLPLVLAGIGFFGGVGLFLVGYRRRLLYPLAALYTAIQVVAWAVVNAGAYTTVGYVDKAVQVALLAALVALYRRA